MDIDPKITGTAARNSVLMDPNLAGHLLNLAKNSEQDGIGKLSSMAMRSVACSINRGIKHMIETLRGDYIDLLNQHSLFDPLLNYFVQVSGQSTIPFDDDLRCAELKDMKLE